LKRRSFIAAMSALALAPAASRASGRFDRGLLWRVSSKKAAPSHVYGTIHISDPRLAELPPPVRKAFDAARALMLEFVPDGYARQRFLEAAVFLDGQTLEDKIGKEDFERAYRHLAAIGLQREFVNKLKPWGVLLNLQNPKGAQGSPLDSQLLELALARRMPLSQIEGVEEQIFTFDEFPMDSQIALLKHSLGHTSELIALGERTLDAYLAGDLARISKLRDEFAARHPEIASHQAIMTKRIVHDRNVVMAFRMQRELRRGNVFIAVGALHLYGPHGVLARLEADGYRAARVF
jgi:uncharacterized protein YbaP (TraB family)